MILENSESVGAIDKLIAYEYPWNRIMIKITNKNGYLNRIITSKIREWIV